VLGALWNDPSEKWQYLRGKVKIGFIDNYDDGKESGMQGVYGKLSKEEKVEETNVVASFEFKVGGSQWKVFESENFQHQLEVSADAQAPYRGQAHANLFESFLSVIERALNPVIALKPSCLQLFEEHPYLKDSLLCPASFIYDYLRGTCFLPQNEQDVKSEVAQTLRAINEHVGPIVRIKDQTHLGFIIVNVLFWHHVDTAQKADKPQKQDTGPRNKPKKTESDPDAKECIDAKGEDAPVTLHLQAQPSMILPPPLILQKSTVEKHQNVSMICEVQIRVTGAPDDHIWYEMRRTFNEKDKRLDESIADFFSNACNFEFCKYTERRKLTLYQDARGQIRQAFSGTSSDTSDHTSAPASVSAQAATSAAQKETVRRQDKSSKE